MNNSDLEGTAKVSVFVMGAAIGEGAGVAGTEAGPRTLRTAGLLDRLLSAGHRVKDAGDLPRPEPRRTPHPGLQLKALAEVTAWSDLIRQVVHQLPVDSIPILLGGDHSLSLGSVPGLAERARRFGRPFFVLWIDAHPDCHTLATTQSGHLHGTPVAYALGETGFTSGFPVPAAPVAGANIMLLGIRSIDDAESTVIVRHGLAVHGPAELRRRGITAVLAPFLERVARENGMLHVSLDADALDPSIAPGVGTPVADGLMLEEAREIMSLIASSGTLSSLDLVEVNPFLDRGQHTALAMVDLATTAFGSIAVETIKKSLSR
jgi:arginase